jgi:hypothetical protein
VALAAPYLITTKNLVGFLNAIPEARAPERFTTRFLEQLGFKSTNDRGFISMLKALNLSTMQELPRSATTNISIRANPRVFLRMVYAMPTRIFSKLTHARTNSVSTR